MNSITTREPWNPIDPASLKSDFINELSLANGKIDFHVRHRHFLSNKFSNSEISSLLFISVGLVVGFCLSFHAEIISARPPLGNAGRGDCGGCGRAAY